MYFGSCLRVFTSKGSWLRLSLYQHLGCRALTQVPYGVDGIFKNNEVNARCCRFASSATKDEGLGKEVYYGPLATRIRTVKLFCLSTSTAGLMIQPVIIQKMLEGDTSLGVMIFSGVVIQFFTFVTPFLLHYITKRYVRAIYYNSKNDEYTALTFNFFTARQTLIFKPDDVVVPDIPGLFTSVIVKGYPLFIEANYFDDVSHYKRIMGYDKPIDFKLEDYKLEKKQTKE